jgi:hypothetical protein
MVTLTFAEAKSAFDHVLNNLLGRNDNSNLKGALLGETYLICLPLMMTSLMTMYNKKKLPVKT